MANKYKCTPCDRATREISSINKQRAIQDAISYAKKNGLSIMVVGVCSENEDGRQRWTYCTVDEDTESLNPMEYISIL